MQFHLCLITTGLGSLLVFAQGGCGAGEGDGADVDVALSCFEVGCFDGDPCTEDHCLPSGECLFVPSNPEGACLEDFHCDTKNPCATGTCEIDSCDNLRCRVLEAPNCLPCGEIFGPCDDGNPCTRDTCGVDTEVCEFGPSEVGCEPGCSFRNAMNVADTLWFDGSIEGSFVGLAEPRALACETGCECEQPLVLVEGEVALELDSPTGESPYRCTVSTCGDLMVDCGAFAYQRQYVVWGDGSRREYGRPKDAPMPPSEGDAGAPMPLGLDVIWVEGFCPSTSTQLGALLNGDWRARFEGSGEAASFVMRFVHTGPGEFGFVGEVSQCEGCEQMSIDVGPIPCDATEPGLELTLTIEGQPASARVFGRQGTLAGDVYRAEGSFVGVFELRPMPHPLSDVPR